MMWLRGVQASLCHMLTTRKKCIPIPFLAAGIFLGISSWLAWKGAHYWHEKILQNRLYNQKMLIHRKKRRLVAGCVFCGREILPGQQIFTCGCCREVHTLCLHCFSNGHVFPLRPISRFPANNGKTTFQQHSFFPSIVRFEVDASDSIDHSKPGSCLCDILDQVFKTYSERRLLGCRAISSRSPILKGKNAVMDDFASKVTAKSARKLDFFEWLSYVEVERCSLALMYQVLEQIPEKISPLSLKHDCQRNANNMIVILFAETSILWYLTILGLWGFSIVVVPVPSTTNAQDLASIMVTSVADIVIAGLNLQNTVDKAIQIAIASTEGIHRIKSPLDGNIKPKVVWLDTVNEWSAKQLFTGKTNQKTKKVIYLWNLRSAKGPQIQQAILARRNIRRFISNCCDDTVMLVPTSGTSGVNVPNSRTQPTPLPAAKLVIFTQSMILHQCKPPSFGAPCVMLSVQPLRHCYDVLVKGGSIAVPTAGHELLHEDLQLVRPTLVGATPLFWDNLRRRFNFDVRYEAKKSKDSSKNNHACRQDFFEDELGAEFRDIVLERWKSKCPLGNRCQIAIIGGARSSNSLREFIFDTFGTVVIDGFGSTEIGGITSSGTVHTGVRIQLRDCPELGFTTMDRPFPRGELLVSAQRMTPGYYRRKPCSKIHGDERNSTPKDRTTDPFVQIGGVRYYCTGDIVAIDQEGKIAIIDRKSAMVKLGHGLYVSPAHLETIYKHAIGVRQIFLDRGRSSDGGGVLVAIVVPDLAFMPTNNMNLSESGVICSCLEWHQLIVDNLHYVAFKYQLRAHEIP